LKLRWLLFIFKIFKTLLSTTFANTFTGSTLTARTRAVKPPPAEQIHVWPLWKPSYFPD
jgi:hypothetical protein